MSPSRPCFELLYALPAGSASKPAVELVYTPDAIGIDLAFVIGAAAGVLAIIPYVGGAVAFASAAGMCLLQFGVDVHSRAFHDDVKYIWTWPIMEIPIRNYIEFVVMQSMLDRAGLHWTKDLELKVRGDDVPRVLEAANRIREAIARQPGTLDPQTDYLQGKRELRVSLSERGRIQGITVASLAAQVRAAFYGDEALAFQRGATRSRSRSATP